MFIELQQNITHNMLRLLWLKKAGLGICHDIDTQFTFFATTLFDLTLLN